MSLTKSNGEVSLKLSNGFDLRIATQDQAKYIESQKEEGAASRKKDVFGSIIFGGSVWGSAQVLSAFLSAEPGRVEGKRVLELGCGCGMAGLAAGALGAREVTLTDQTTFMAQYDLDKNFGGGHLSPEEKKATSCGFRVSKLTYGNKEDILEADGPFDLLLGTDIMYASGAFPELAQTIALLSGPNTKMLMVTPNWPPQSTDRKRNFEDPLAKAGFEFVDLSKTATAKEIIANAGTDRGPITVMEIRRTAAEVAATSKL